MGITYFKKIIDGTIYISDSLHKHDIVHTYFPLTDDEVPTDSLVFKSALEHGHIIVLESINSIHNLKQYVKSDETYQKTKEESKIAELENKKQVEKIEKAQKKEKIEKEKQKQKELELIRKKEQDDLIVFDDDDVAQKFK
mgnify:CR=1 FL=1